MPVVRRVIQIFRALANRDLTRVGGEIADGRRDLIEKQLLRPLQADPLTNHVPIFIVGGQLRRFSLEDVKAAVLGLDAGEWNRRGIDCLERQVLLRARETPARVVPPARKSRTGEQANVDCVLRLRIELETRAEALAMLKLIRRNSAGGRIDEAISEIKSCILHFDPAR